MVTIGKLKTEFLKKRLLRAEAKQQELQRKEKERADELILQQELEKRIKAAKSKDLTPAQMKALEMQKRKTKENISKLTSSIRSIGKETVKALAVASKEASEFVADERKASKLPKKKMKMPKKKKMKKPTKTIFKRPRPKMNKKKKK